MAGSSGSSKLLFLVDLVFTYRPNSPLKRCSNPFSDSFKSYSATCTKRPTEYCMPHVYRGVNGLRG
jgi:hypothetical protein